MTMIEGGVAVVVVEGQLVLSGQILISATTRRFVELSPLESEILCRLMAEPDSYVRTGFPNVADLPFSIRGIREKIAEITPEWTILGSTSVGFALFRGQVVPLVSLTPIEVGVFGILGLDPGHFFTPAEIAAEAGEKDEEKILVVVAKIKRKLKEKGVGTIASRNNKLAYLPTGVLGRFNR